MPITQNAMTIFIHMQMKFAIKIAFAIACRDFRNKLSNLLM